MIMVDHPNVPTCPKCGSTNIEKGVMVDWKNYVWKFSSKNLKCNNCKLNW